MDEFRQTTDPVAVWLDRNTVLEPDAVIPPTGFGRTTTRTAWRKAGQP